MLENQIICGTWRIFLKKRLTVQDKQGTHEQLSLNTAVDHSGKKQGIKNQGDVNIWMG